MATAIWYLNAFKAAFNKEIDFNTDTIKAALVTSSYTPDQDAHDYWDDVSANEVANGAGYTTGGATMASCTVTVTGATNIIKFDADDVSWAALTKAFQYAVIYESTGVAGTSALICYIDLGAQSVTAQTFTIQFDANGIAKITAS